ncbi:MAG: hypothetical protein ACOC1P_00185 [Minisyncoccales bacterium]
MKSQLNLEFSENPLEASFYVNREDYIGRIYSLSNSESYAIVYEEQGKGPPNSTSKLSLELLETGELSSLKSPLSKKIYDRSLSMGKTLSKIRNLEFNPDSEDIFSKFRGNSIFPHNKSTNNFSRDSDSFREKLFFL